MMWKERYRVGVDLIDDQHKELFEYVSNFLQVVRSDQPWESKLDKVKETMVFMQNYVVEHFDDEEAYQKKINYPHIKEHKIAHAKFKQGVNDYVKIFEEKGFTEDLVQEFGGKLMAWLILHVGQVDQKIGEFIRSKGGEI